ncbi:cytochrome c [Thalassobaculum fulvum]|uniref:Cytochrome c n=1 Tax=Thalassobaculum fulvum TaxID=1633335 RepID=A0A918XTH9_9PROT|nr:cytochrome c [Thalassobaculum fulvum]GHD52069.1 cytochrome c [Thalassobaculum fulvum]
MPLSRARIVLIAASGLALAGGLAVFLSAPTQEPAAGIALAPDDPAVVAEGRGVYADQCASCHGADLQGQPNWQARGPDGKLPAPPHDPTGHTWHHPDSVLFALTKYGPARMIGDPAYKSDMPAYDETLSDDQIIAALSYIKSTWPADIRQRHDRINEQARQN